MIPVISIHFSAANSIIAKLHKSQSQPGISADVPGYRGSPIYPNDVGYYYITNLQGDVMYLIDANENTVAAYEYDPYGNIVSATGAMAEINPLRYRGYYYDAELEMYYVQSRDYDPTICRFINADDASLVGATGTTLGYNLFAYCENNPISLHDKTGYLLAPALLGAAFAVVTTYLLYLVEYRLGVRNWNWLVLSGQLIVNAAIGAANGVLFGGPFAKLTKLASLAKRAKLSGFALKAIKAVATGTTFFINSIIKPLTRKPGESWPKAVKRWFS